MSSQQPNAWQTAKPRHSHSASRTPQSRPGTASPQQANPTQPPRQDRLQQSANSAWAQRASQSGERQQGAASNGRPEMPAPSPAQNDEPHAPANGFNSADVRAFLGRDDRAASVAYKPVEAGAGARAGAGAWGAKPNHMANNQPFFVQLAKQISNLENGG